MDEILAAWCRSAVEPIRCAPLNRHPPFPAVLVANRGEIAVRVIRTCRDLSIRAVAVHSDPDRAALHVRLADDTVALAGATPAETYLDVEALVDAARQSGVAAVHPGYGFLSEHAGFARAVAEAGLVFIGPPPGAIEVMGDKPAARAAAIEAGVPVLPGSDGPVEDPRDIELLGRESGWPVAIKAAYGGGGRGIRLVRGPDEAASAWASARAEALLGFGRAECYAEQYLSDPRHIEVQVLLDAAGRGASFPERDCSIQRRHQKLLEESPAPGLPAGLRRTMGEAALAVAAACGYAGAGTVEFLVEGDRFFFLEMNTRLQVEHPVTEMVTGVDLVAAQIQVAAGGMLPVSAGAVPGRGHAFECRINAEDPAGGRFLPTPGRIARLVVPQGPSVRWDAGYEAGDEVPPHYDNLIAKLVVWGPDRDTTRARLRRALHELEVDGVATTAPAHRVIVDDPRFVAGGYSTRFLENLDLNGLAAREAAKPPPGHRPARREVRVGGRWYHVPRFDGRLADRPAGGRAPGGPPPAPGSGPAEPDAGRPGAVTSQMSGTVMKIMVEVGDAVEAGQPVCVMEAMKMEAVLGAPGDGTVVEVAVVAGQAVRAGEVLVVVR